MKTPKLFRYFHRGAFFLDEDDEVLKRDFAAPTLEDRFDRTVMPKVMQVRGAVVCIRSMRLNAPFMPGTTR